VPLPLPLLPPVIVIQLAALVADQAQPFVAVTATVAAPPATGAAADVGEIAYVQDGGGGGGGAPAAWLTVTICPATVSVPLRALLELFAAALNCTWPLPEPEAPLVTVIHDALLVAFQTQPAAAATANDPVTAPALIEVDGGVTEYEHEGVGGVGAGAAGGGAGGAA
jgi:hypothetical protein